MVWSKARRRSRSRPQQWAGLRRAGAEPRPCTRVQSRARGRRRARSMGGSPRWCTAARRLTSAGSSLRARKNRVRARARRSQTPSWGPAPSRTAQHARNPRAVARRTPRPTTGTSRASTRRMHSGRPDRSRASNTTGPRRSWSLATPRRRCIATRVRKEILRSIAHRARGLPGLICSSNSTCGGKRCEGAIEHPAGIAGRCIDHAFGKDLPKNEARCTSADQCPLEDGLICSGLTQFKPHGLRRTAICRAPGRGRKCGTRIRPDRGSAGTPKAST